MRLTRLEEYAGSFVVMFERGEGDEGDIFYAFLQAIPGLERQAIHDGQGGWRVLATPQNERRLASLFPDFAARRARLRTQLQLF